MDPDIVPPDLLWKQGNLYNPKSDEVSLNLFPNIPKDAIPIDEIPGFAKGKENDKGSILLEKVEGSHFNEDQKEDLLSLTSKTFRRMKHDIIYENVELFTLFQIAYNCVLSNFQKLHSISEI